MLYKEYGNDFNTIRHSILEEGFEETVISLKQRYIWEGAAGIIAAFMIITAIIYFAIPSYYKEAVLFFYEAYDVLGVLGVAAIIETAVIINTHMHRWLHALGWGVISDIDNAIRVNAELPIHTCNYSMNIWRYSFGEILPVFLLGIFPFLIGLIISNIPAALAGIAGIACGIDDISKTIRVYSEVFPDDSIILEHKEDAGFSVFVKK